jgi:Archaeal ATPase.
MRSGQAQAKGTGMVIRMETEKIQEMSRQRARALTEYLCFGKEALREEEGAEGEGFPGRRAAFFRWFTEEKYSWYAALVLEECRRLFREEEACASFAQELEAGSLMVLGMLYRRSGRRKDYLNLCRQTAKQFEREAEEGALSSSREECVLFARMSAFAGDASFFGEGSWKEAGRYYELYFLYGGKKESIRRKYRKCLEEGYRPKFRKIRNGYVVGKAVSGSGENEKYFVGRERLIEEYYRRLIEEHAGMLVFYGQYRVGKTSVLINLKARLERRECGREMLAHVSMEDYETESAFYEGVMKDISSRRNRKYRDFLRGLSGEVTKVPKEPDFEAFREFLEKMGEVFQAFYGNPFRLILFIDEFIAAVEKPGIDDSSFLRKLKGLVDRDMLQLVITGSESLGEYISRGGGKNLLPDKLPYLPREAVIRLLEEPIRKIDGSSRYEKEPQVLSGVYELTKGNPILTQAIAYSLVNKLNERGQEDVTGELLAEVVDEIVRENHNTWRARFSPLMNCETAKGRWEEADVTELCKGLERAKEEGDDALEAFLQGLSEKEREVYTALKERDVIKLDEKMLPYVEVSLFGKWCRYE